MRKTILEANSSARLVPAVERAAQIMDSLAQANEGLRLADLVRQTGLPKSSVHGLCQTLVALKLLRQNPDGTFVIGPHSVRWAGAFHANNDIVDAFHMALNEAEGVQAHSLTLSCLEGPEVVYLSCRNSAAPLGITFRIGMRVPAIFTATGKAMLAALPYGELSRHLPAEWPDLPTSTSVASIKALEDEMQDIQRNGYSFDNGQLREGMFCIGAAICDRPQHPVAGIALSMMAAEGEAAAIAQAGQQVRMLANNIGARMGWL